MQYVGFQTNVGKYSSKSLVREKSLFNWRSVSRRSSKLYSVKRGQRLKGIGLTMQQGISVMQSKREDKLGHEESFFNTVNAIDPSMKHQRSTLTVAKGWEDQSRTRPIALKLSSAVCTSTFKSSILQLRSGYSQFMHGLP